jgi:hypothetical protein
MRVLYKFAIMEAEVPVAKCPLPRQVAKWGNVDTPSSLHVKGFSTIEVGRKASTPSIYNGTPFASMICR